MNPKTAKYLHSPQKRWIDITLATILIIALFPFLLLISLAILITSGQPVIFTQKRTGKNFKTFYLYKFRTMIKGAPQQKWRYLNQNQSKPPLFKIHHDPRFTRIGKVLSQTGFDELPQLINILKGDMSLAGPRPFIPPEAKLIPPKYSSRFTIKPVITSFAVVADNPHQSIKHWLKLDLHYLATASLKSDLYLLFKTILNAFSPRSAPTQTPPNRP